jgi:hypothetical protein
LLKFSSDNTMFILALGRYNSGPHGISGCILEMETAKLCEMLVTSTPQHTASQELKKIT